MNKLFISIKSYKVKMSRRFSSFGKIVEVVGGIPLFSFLHRIKNYGLYAKALQGKIGLEIGGPSVIFEDYGSIPVYKVVKQLDWCNFSSSTIWDERPVQRRPNRFHRLKRNGQQYIAEGTDLKAIPSAKYDFVLSSHCLEHIANPLKVMLEWLRVMKVGGYLLLVVPHKNGTFDHKRPLTTMEHLKEDFAKDMKENDLTHLEESIRLHDLSLDPEAGSFEQFKTRLLNNYRYRSLHHHVFDTNLVLQILDYLRLQLISVDPVMPGNIITLSQKKKDRDLIDNGKFLGDNAEYKRNSPFMSDRKTI